MICSMLTHSSNSTWVKVSSTTSCSFDLSFPFASKVLADLILDFRPLDSPRLYLCDCPSRCWTVGIAHGHPRWTNHRRRFYPLEDEALETPSHHSIDRYRTLSSSFGWCWSSRNQHTSRRFSSRPQYRSHIRPPSFDHLYFISSRHVASGQKLRSTSSFRK